MRDLSLDDIFGPRTPEQIAKAALQKAAKAVQSSLFRRLGERGYGQAGRLAWLLCFAGGPSDHPKSAESRAALAARSREELAGIRDVVRGSHKSKGADNEWRAFTGEIEAMLTALIGSSEEAPPVRTREGDEALSAWVMNPERVAFYAAIKGRVPSPTEKAEALRRWPMPKP